MTVALLMAAGGVAAGTFGSLLGLGGGILIVPLLTLGFGLPLREAVGVSLVSVIVTSSAAAGVYLQRHVANLRLGMSLELFTAIGALAGGLVAFLLPDRVVAGLFALLLAYTAATMVRRAARRPEAPGPATSTPDAPGATRASAELPAGLDPEGAEPPAGLDPGAGAGFVASLSGPGYTVRRYPFGILGSLFAGLVSAILGVGGGIVKVPLMNLAMGVPLRVATATSNLMIGITASASAVVYLLRGGIDPYVAAPTALGVFVGAAVGARVSHRIDVRVIRILFIVVLAYTAWQMAVKALG
ncbi:MAG: sulfite exporter TauE/SafE family protein [Chloroflexota bacterium]